MQRFATSFKKFINFLLYCYIVAPASAGPSFIGTCDRAGGFEREGDKSG
jgi:hypothetical protein